MEYKKIDFSHVADELQLEGNQAPLYALVVLLGKKQVCSIVYK